MKSTKITAQGMGRDYFFEENADFLEKSVYLCTNK